MHIMCIYLSYSFISVAVLHVYNWKYFSICHPIYVHECILLLLTFTCFVFALFSHFIRLIYHHHIYIYIQQQQRTEQATVCLRQMVLPIVHNESKEGEWSNFSYDQKLELKWYYNGVYDQRIISNHSYKIIYNTR